jgi:hypothetical protein
MAKYNLSKIAKVDDGLQPYSSRLQDQSKKMKIETKDDDAKNLNLKLKTKDKDNTIPYEKQLEASRTNKDGYMILEKAMDKSEWAANKRDMQNKKMTVSPINVLSEEFDQKKVEAIKKAEGKLKNDNSFWDKYVGEQLLGPKTTVDTTNTSNSQLQNQPDRFSFNKETDVTKVVNTTISKMAMQTLKDADALLLQIYTTAALESRDVTKNEQNFINRINKEKEYVLAQSAVMDTVDNMIITLEGNAAIVYRNGEIVVNNDGTQAIYNKFPEAAQNIDDAKSEFYDVDLDQKCLQAIGRA